MLTKFQLSQISCSKTPDSYIIVILSNTIMSKILSILSVHDAFFRYVLSEWYQLTVRLTCTHTCLLKYFTSVTLWVTGQCYHQLLSFMVLELINISEYLPSLPRTAVNTCFSNSIFHVFEWKQGNHYCFPIATSLFFSVAWAFYFCSI